MSFEPLVDLPAAHEPDALAFAFSGDLLLVRDGAPLTAAELDGIEPLPLGRLNGRLCLAFELPDGYEPGPGLALEHLRPLWGRLPDPLWTLAGRALQTVAWYRDNAFCGRCGTPTERLAGERARGCPNCGLAAYPRLAPAVIVLIERDGKALLCHGVRFPGTMYSCLAGFVEPGESLEECVHREIREEAGIEVTDLTYAGSQPWPFPHSLMVGFFARYAGGELKLDPTEIVDGDWFGPDELPAVPPYPSIARRLIDEWLERQGAVSPT
jgi:NAD+ diphosphatase